jgi:hypothetical protein
MVYGYESLDVNSRCRIKKKKGSLPYFTNYKSGDLKKHVGRSLSGMVYQGQLLV